MKKQFFSLILAGCLTLGIGVAVSAHQSLTMNAVEAADNGNVNLRWEPHYGRIIVGFGIINEDGIDYDNWRETEVSGIELLFGGRRYLSQFTKKGDNFSGVFFDGELALQTVNLKCKAKRSDYTYKEEDKTYTAIKALVGYKFISGKRSGLTVEFAAGPQFNFGDEFYGYKEDSSEAVAMINLGYTW